MTTTKYDEGSSYFVYRLHLLDLDGTVKLVQDVAVVFTPGWMDVQESSGEGYVVPRQRVLLAERVR